MNVLAIDTETNGVHWDAQPFVVSMAEEGTSWAYDLDVDPNLRSNVRLNVAEADRIIMHNCRFDTRVLENIGIIVPREKVFDTHPMSHLLDEHRSHKLKDLAKTVLDEETDEDVVVKGWRMAIKKEQGLRYVADVDWRDIPRDVLLPYAIKDAEFTFKLYHKLWPQIEADPDLLSEYYREMQVLWVADDIAREGLQTDQEFAQSEYRRLGDLVLKLEREVVALSGREDFNPNSPKQLAQVYVEAGIEPPRTEKGNYSVNNLFLQTAFHPIGEKVLKLRSAAKMRNTYFHAIVTEVDEHGILHTQLNTLGTKTSRMSAGGSEDG